MTTYEVADSSVKQMVDKIINTYPNKFIHINPNEIHTVFKVADKSTWKARIRLTKGFVQTLTTKKIVLEVHKADWESSKEEQRALVVYHELMHVVFDEKKNDYKLRKHDVEDFYEVLKTFGLDHENANTILKTEKV